MSKPIKKLTREKRKAIRPKLKTPLLMEKPNWTLKIPLSHKEKLISMKPSSPVKKP